MKRELEVRIVEEYHVPADRCWASHRQAETDHIAVSEVESYN